MSRLSQLYERACNDAARMETPELDSEMRRIWILLGALSDARWRLAAQPAKSALDLLLQEPYRPESDDECEIWCELTAPHNYFAVLRFVEFNAGRVHEHAARLRTTLLNEARHRLKSRR